MSKELDKAVSSVMNRIDEWTNNRLAEFIAQLIKSGDVFLIKGPTKFITEENIDKTRLINFSECNLSAYEPFHLRESLERKLEAERAKSKKLVEVLEQIRDEVGDSERRDVPIIYAIIKEALKSYNEGAE